MVLGWVLTNMTEGLSWWRKKKLLHTCNFHYRGTMNYARGIYYYVWWQTKGKIIHESQVSSYFKRVLYHASPRQASGAARYMFLLYTLLSWVTIIRYSVVYHKVSSVFLSIYQHVSGQNPYRTRLASTYIHLVPVAIQHYTKGHNAIEFIGLTPSLAFTLNREMSSSGQSLSVF